MKYSNWTIFTVTHHVFVGFLPSSPGSWSWRSPKKFKPHFPVVVVWVILDTCTCLLIFRNGNPWVYLSLRTHVNLIFLGWTDLVLAFFNLQPCSFFLHRSEEVAKYCVCMCLNRFWNKYFIIVLETIDLFFRKYSSNFKITHFIKY